MIKTLQVHCYKINRFEDARGPVAVKTAQSGLHETYANPNLDKAINIAMAANDIMTDQVINIVPIDPQPGHGEDDGSLNLLIIYRTR